MFKFDSIYYQDLMSFDEFPVDLIEAIEPYRIYI